MVSSRTDSWTQFRGRVDRERVKISKDECRHTQREDKIPHLADIDLRCLILICEVEGGLVTVRLSSDVNLIYKRSVLRRQSRDTNRNTDLFVFRFESNLYMNI